MELVTGSTGYLGRALIERLKNVRALARNEGKLVEIKDKCEILTGDISDAYTIKRAMQGADEVYHLGAIKGVDVAENQPYECVKTNIIGTANLVKESLETKPRLFVFISTDKASQVSGVYGASKLIGERLIKEAEKLNPDTKYRVVRYGNVWGSTGSFITKWIPAIKRGEGIKLTDPEMTRFFWTREQAVDHIFDCVNKASDSTPYIPEMKAMRMGDIVEALKEIYGDFPVEIIGNRGGENVHETMGVKNDKGELIYSNMVPRFSINEIKILCEL